MDDRWLDWANLRGDLRDRVREADRSGPETEDMRRLLGILEQLPTALGLYEREGIGIDVFRDTMADIGVWAANHERDCGIYGISATSYGWLSNHVAARLYRVGRMQCQPKAFAGFGARLLRHRATGRIVALGDGGLYRRDGLPDGTDGVHDAQAFEAALRVFGADEGPSGDTENAKAHREGDEFIGMRMDRDPERSRSSRRDDDARGGGVVDGDACDPASGTPACRRDAQHGEGIGARAARELSSGTRAGTAGPRIEGHIITAQGRVSRERASLPLCEYERVLEPSAPVLDLHIPQEDDFSLETLGDSLRAMLAFAARHADAIERLCGVRGPFEAFTLSSWLIDAQLAKLLPATSNIVRFLREFVLLPSRAGQRQAIERIFGHGALDIAHPTEAQTRTSLQRAVLAFLRDGGRMAGANGVLFVRDVARFGCGGARGS